MAASTHHRELAQYFYNQADWRRGKIAEYPHDADRNAQSADALVSLAEYIESGDAEVVGLLPHSFAGGDMLGGERVKAETIRYGFGYAVKSHLQHDEMLEELLLAALADAYDLVADEETEDPTYTLWPCEVVAAQAMCELPDSYWRLRVGMSESEAEELLSAYLDEEVAA